MTERITQMSEVKYYRDNHLMLNAFEGRGAYYLTLYGSPYICEGTHEYGTTRVIELLTSKRAANKALKEAKSDSPSDVFDIAYASNIELLRLILRCDVILIGSASYPISLNGLHYEQEDADDKLEISTFESIGTALILEQSPEK